MLLSVEPDRLPTRTPPHERKQTSTDFAHDTEIQQQRNNQPSKVDKTTQKKLKILLIISLSKSTPCNSLQARVEVRRRIETGGVFPCFCELLQSGFENFSVPGNHFVYLLA
jgi:hypothetical protein